MSKAVGIKAGDFIECEGCMYSDFVVGHSYEVHEDDNGLYMLGGLGDKLRLSEVYTCLLYTSPSPRDRTRSRMPSSA